MSESGWAARVTADYLVGRRFTWMNGAAPDITFVAGDGIDQPNPHVHAHALDGGKEWLPVADVKAAIMAGILVESDGVAFVNETKTRGLIPQRMTLAQWLHVPGKAS
jgi:hypothetical protein